MRFGPLLLVVLTGIATPAHAQTIALPPEGPDAPVLGTPAAVIDAFADERFSFEEAPHTTTVDVPAGVYGRIVLQFSGRPDGDPWDRLFGVGIGGVEVMRGTTPRAAFTVRKDITAFAPLLPPGGRAEVSLLLSTFVGAQLGSVRIELYSSGQLPRGGRTSDVRGAFLWRILQGDELTTTLDVPSHERATVEITLSGHGNEEFWYRDLRGPRLFHVLVDGTEVATAIALPYVYAFVGFSGPIGQDVLHPVMWWSAHQALDVAGVHTGIGEIPPYRAEVTLPQGSRTVTVRQEGGGGVWWASLSFLLAAA